MGAIDRLPDQWRGGSNDTVNDPPDIGDTGRQRVACQRHVMQCRHRHGVDNLKYPGAFDIQRAQGPGDVELQHEIAQMVYQVGHAVIIRWLEIGQSAELAQPGILGPGGFIPAVEADDMA